MARICIIPILIYKQKREVLTSCVEAKRVFICSSCFPSFTSLNIMAASRAAFPSEQEVITVLTEMAKKFGAELVSYTSVDGKQCHYLQPKIKKMKITETKVAMDSFNSLNALPVPNNTATSAAPATSAVFPITPSPALPRSIASTTTTTSAAPSSNIPSKLEQKPYPALDPKMFPAHPNDEVPSRWWLKDKAFLMFDGAVDQYFSRFESSSERSINFQLVYTKFIEFVQTAAHPIDWQMFNTYLVNWKTLHRYTGDCFIRIFATPPDPRCTKHGVASMLRGVVKPYVFWLTLSTSFQYLFRDAINCGVNLFQPFSALRNVNLLSECGYLVGSKEQVKACIAESS